MDSGLGIGIGTLLGHLGEDEKVQGAVIPPIFQNSLFTYDTIEELGAALANPLPKPPYGYSRVANPTVALAETKLAAMEGTDGCRLAGSGMAAITLAVMSVVESGSHVVIVDTAYGPLRQLVGDYLARFGVTHTLVTGCDAQEIFDAVRPETKLIYLESPSSLLFRLQDVEAITKFAKEKGILTAFDNTYNTPIYYQPAKHGVDLVIHSGTKYLGGHSDVTVGAVCASQEHIERISRQELPLFGSVLHPFPGWLLTRGMRTLEVRLARHETTGNTVAQWLSQRPEIERVHHISLPDYPQRDLYLKMLGHSTGLFSFEPKVQDGDKVKAFCNKLKIFERGISWGGFESLVVCMPVKTLDTPEPKWLVRLFCGLEDPKDLVNDLEQAIVELAD